MIKLLIGGSPCTKWSIAQKKDREVTASGEGWELFLNYKIAKDKFKPDFFLYENNKSAAQAIKDQISMELGVPLMHINSALVSAQNRQRFYAFNWTVQQPEDRGIFLKDILESGCADKNKAYCITHSANGGGMGGKTGLHAIPVRVANIGNGGQGNRIYDASGKSCAIIANGGGHGGNGQGLYAVPTETDAVGGTIYEVKDGLIEIKGQKYKIKLPDGFYIIRKLTVTECCRLQTLPDDYCRAVSNSRAYRGLGGGWTAEVIIHILQGALKDVPRDEEIVVLSMYDGIGTGRYCLEQMGFTNIRYYAYEIDPYAMKISASNYPDIIQLGNAFDLRKEDWHLPKEVHKNEKH
jgi:DNA (cytosine-5)-methyltransferase 3A